MAISAKYIDSVLTQPAAKLQPVSMSAFAGALKAKFTEKAYTGAMEAIFLDASKEEFCARFSALCGENDAKLTAADQQMFAKTVDAYVRKQIQKPAPAAQTSAKPEKEKDASESDAAKKAAFKTQLAGIVGKPAPAVRKAEPKAPVIVPDAEVNKDYILMIQKKTSDKVDFVRAEPFMNALVANYGEGHVAKAKTWLLAPTNASYAKGVIEFQGRFNDALANKQYLSGADQQHIDGICKLESIGKLPTIVATKQ